MASTGMEGIRPHGLGWQYRWTPPKATRQSGPVLDLEECKHFKRWVDTNRRKRVMSNDRDIVEGLWRFQPFASSSGDITFGDHAKVYIREQERVVGARSLKNIKNSVARAETIHGALLEDLDEDRLEALEDELRRLKKLKTVKGHTVEIDEPRYAGSTLRTTVVTVRAIVRHAVRTRVILADPSPEFETSLNGDRLREHRYLKPDEYISFRGCAEDDTTRLMMDLMAYAGLRIGEVLGLRVSRVHLDGVKPYIRIDWQVYPDGSGGLPKGTQKDPEKRKRNVRIHDALARDLAAHLARRGDVKSDWLFPATMDETRPVTHNWGATKSSPWSRATAKAEAMGVLSLREGLPTPHDLRHSHASWLFEKNVPLIKVSKRLGHKNIIVTATVYAHVLEMLDDESSNVMEEMFNDEAISRMFSEQAASRPRLALVR